MLLVDSRADGHHRLYVQRIVSALEAHCELAIAAPEAVIQDHPTLETLTSSPPRPSTYGRYGSVIGRAAGAGSGYAEMRALEQAERLCKPDLTVHLFADRLLPALIFRRPRDVPRMLLLFRPRRHYRQPFSPPLRQPDAIVANIYEGVLKVWRRRPDAEAVFTLDQEAARLWSKQRGAPAYWFPEPPVLGKPASADLDERSGVVLFGSLSERKGIHLLTRALAKSAIRPAVTLAGEIGPGMSAYVEREVKTMRSMGIDVDLRPHHHSEEEALSLMTAARVVVLPYLGHVGMSRVLLESSFVGTPMVAHNGGLVGHIVRSRTLGLTVDAENATTFGKALDRLSSDDSLWEKSAGSAVRFASQYSASNFADALLAPCKRPLGADLERAQ